MSLLGVPWNTTFISSGFTNRGKMAGGLEAGEGEAACQAPLTVSVPGTKGPEPGT